MFRTVSLTTLWAALGDLVAGRISALNNTAVRLQMRQATNATTGCSLPLLSRNISALRVQTASGIAGLNPFQD